MSLELESTFDYSVSWNRTRGLCRLRSFSTSMGPVVIFTELAENPGPSVTNAAVELVHQAAGTLGLSIEETIWIEEYGPESYPSGDRDREFARIRLTEGRVGAWEHMPIALVQLLLGPDYPVLR